MKKLALRFEDIDHVKRIPIKLSQETIDHLDKQKGKPASEYLKEYLNDNKLYNSFSKKYIDFVNKTLPKRLQESCLYCNGDSNDTRDKKCNSYHDEAQMNFFFASHEFVTVVEHNKHLIQDKVIRKKLTLQFYECFAFNNGRVIFDLEKMAILCLKAGFLSLSKVFANNTALQNLSIINHAIDELNDQELDADMLNREKSIYLEFQKTFFKNKYEHYQRSHFIEKQEQVLPIKSKDKSKSTTIPQYALYYYYLQESGDIEYFENHPKGKVTAIAELIKTEHLNTTKKYFQKVYNKFAHYRTNRVAKRQMANIDYVANTMLKNYPKAQEIARLELQEAKTKNR